MNKTNEYLNMDYKSFHFRRALAAAVTDRHRCHICTESLNLNHINAKVMKYKSFCHGSYVIPIR